MKVKVHRKKNQTESSEVKSYWFYIVVVIILIIIFILARNPQSEVTQMTGDTDKSEVVVSKSEADELVGLTKAEQKQIDDTNRQNIAENLANGINYIVVPDLGVELPIYSFHQKLTAENVSEVLSKGALTYNEYGSPGHGNYILFGHNSGAYPQGYFTPFVEGLKKDSIVTIRTATNDYQYKITEVKTVGENDVDEVYYTSTKPILTIGTCDIPSATTDKRIIFTGELIE